MKYFFVISLIFLCTCKNTGTPTSDKTQLPNTPVEVAQEWVEAFYKDDFKKAKYLGTELTQMMIDSVKKEMQNNVPFIPFKISEMVCDLHLDSATCTYIYQEEEDHFEEYVNLIKVNDQWMVDESWDSSSEIEQEFEMIQEEIKKLIKEEETISNKK